jgi:hypothetical protein
MRLMLRRTLASRRPKRAGRSSGRPARSATSTSSYSDYRFDSGLASVIRRPRASGQRDGAGRVTGEVSSAATAGIVYISRAPRCACGELPGASLWSDVGMIPGQYVRPRHDVR